MTIFMGISDYKKDIRLKYFIIITSSFNFASLHSLYKDTACFRQPKSCFS